MNRPHIRKPFCGRGDGLRVASTLWLPHLWQRSRLTNAAIGVLGVIAKRASVSAVNMPTCRQRRHSTVTFVWVRTRGNPYNRNAALLARRRLIDRPLVHVDLRYKIRRQSWPLAVLRLVAHETRHAGAAALAGWRMNAPRPVCMVLADPSHVFASGTGHQINMAPL